MKTTHRFSIKSIESGSKEVFLVTGYRANGKQVRRRFPSMNEAEGYRQVLEIEELNSSSATPKITRLSETQLGDAEKAFGILREGTTLLDAVSFYNEHYRPSMRRITVSDALPLYEAAKKAENIRERSIKENLIVVGHLPGNAHIDEIQPAEIRNLISGGSPSTFNTKRGRMASFFTWAVKEQYCKESPIDRIPSMKSDEKEPEIFSLPEVHRILQAATETRDGSLLPFVTLGLFAGMRPEEIQKLKWADISIKEKHLTITGRIAKKRKRRIVELHENAVAWLKECKGTPIYPESFRSHFNELKLNAGFQPDKWKVESLKRKAGIDEEKTLELSPWIRDGIRHTAISHHLSGGGDENVTASWAGNSPRVIHESYKGLVRKTESEAFWNILPDNIEADNIVELSSKAG
jgi:integrase